MSERDNPIPLKYENKVAKEIKKAVKKCWKEEKDIIEYVTTDYSLLRLHEDNGGYSYQYQLMIAGDYKEPQVQPSQKFQRLFDSYYKDTASNIKKIFGNYFKDVTTWIATTSSDPNIRFGVTFTIRVTHPINE